jgi:serine/threonine-protein kinase HipA
LPAAEVELIEAAGRPWLVVSRFDRDRATTPARRVHQEDLCQAIGLIPGYKYAAPDRPRPSFRDLGEVLRDHGALPGLDRIAVGRMATFNFLIGNADAHGKNVSVLHDGTGRVRLAPLYDLVSTAAFPGLDATLAMSIGDEFDPGEVTAISFDDLASDLGLTATIFARDRRRLVAATRERAVELVERARHEGWHAGGLDAIVRTIEARAAQAA